MPLQKWHKSQTENTIPKTRGRTRGLQQRGDDLVRVALVDQELLALGGEVHLLQGAIQ